MGAQERERERERQTAAQENAVRVQMRNQPQTCRAQEWPMYKGNTRYAAGFHAHSIQDTRLAQGVVVAINKRPLKDRTEEMIIPPDALHVPRRMTVRLAVAGAFHTEFMRPAAEKLQAALAQTEVRCVGAEHKY